MRNKLESSRTHFIARILALAVVVCTVTCVQIFTVRGSASTAVSNALMGITVTNNSTREICHLYLTPVDHDAWGPDLMSEGTTIRTGQSFTVSDVACSANEIKVVGEDREGCFVYGVVSCAQGSASWVITNDTQRDCGN